MADELRIGVIGTGMIGKTHLKNYAGLADHKVVALADLNVAEAERVADEYKVADVYSDFRELIARDDIDAVDVCLHNNLHAPVTIAALEAGKHVYCEKPMAGSYIDAKAMLEKARELGRLLHIQLSSLYSKEHKAAKHLIEGGHLGKLYYARSVGWRRRGRVWVDGYGTPAFVQKSIAAGGALYDMGIYHIAQILDLLGNPSVETVTGATYQEIPLPEQRAREANYDVEELGLGHVRLSDGMTLSIEEAWAIHYDNSESSKVLGSLGGVKLNPLTFFSTAGDLDFSATLDHGAADTRWHRYDPGYGAFDSSQAHWIAALHGRVELLPTAELALNVALISEGIYLSQKLGRELAADEILAKSESTAVKLEPKPAVV